MYMNRFAIAFIGVAAFLASAKFDTAASKMPTMRDCANACAASNERVGSFKIEGGNAHCVCECKLGWSRKQPGGVCERQAQSVQRIGDAENFCHAKSVVAADQRAIAAMNFNNEAQSFEMFASISKKEKAKFEERTLSALLDQALELSTAAAMSAKSLNTFNVNDTIKRLRAAGLAEEHVISALRTIAGTRDKPAMAEAYKVVVGFVKAGKEGYDTGKDMAADRKNARLRFLLGLLKVAQGNPEVGLGLTGLEFAESLAYLGYNSSKVDELNQITDDKLVVLESRFAQLKADVAALQKAKAEWRAANINAPNGEPACRP